MPFRPRTLARMTFAALLLLPLARAASSAPMSVTLDLSSLPSAQGWSYVASGSHAGVAEASVFAVAGGVLTQTTVGQVVGTAGGGLYYQLVGGLTASENKQLVTRARCTQVQGSTTFPSGQGGLLFGFATGSTQYGFSVTDTRLFVLVGSSYSQVAGTYDNTTFHDYVFEYTAPSTTKLYRDGVLVHSGTTGGALVANRILFGDATGGANANGQITELRFYQDLATASEGSTWGRIKQLYR